jgi:hypothetical protein
MVSRYLYFRSHTLGMMIALVLIGAASCYPNKFYRNKDYSFYKADFSLPDTTSLRTDGVYILKSIWSQNNGPERIVEAHERIVLKFYSSGQVNLLLDTVDRAVIEQFDYAGAFDSIIDASIQNGSRTLFQGYYSVQGDRLVIQQVNAALQQFHYTYFLIRKDMLTKVSATISGKGGLDDRHFPAYYRAYYTFTPVEGIFKIPNW